MLYPGFVQNVVARDLSSTRVTKIRKRVNPLHIKYYFKSHSSCSLKMKRAAVPPTEMIMSFYLFKILIQIQVSTALSSNLPIEVSCLRKTALKRTDGTSWLVTQHPCMAVWHNTTLSYQNQLVSQSYLTWTPSSLP